MILIKILLFPFAVLYDLIMRIRNHLFRIGYKPSFRFDTFVIGVGNLSMGGSGKTPMVEYLIRLLSGRYELAVLSRGYGRSSKGIQFASESAESKVLGDEPFQIFKKFGEKVKVVVAEDRAFAIPTILQEYSETQVILMDDSFQHQSVNPHLNILLTEYDRPFYHDFILPVGRLRESRAGAARADVIVVTKCPKEMSSSEKEMVEKRICKYSGQKKIYFSTIKYAPPVPFVNGNPFHSRKIVLVSGIANAQPLERFVSSTFQLIKHFRFPDHYKFKKEDLDSIDNYVEQQKGEVEVLTTEKDMARLTQAPYPSFIRIEKWFYLPMEVEFLQSGSDFDSLVISTKAESKTD